MWLLVLFPFGPLALYGLHRLVHLLWLWGARDEGAEPEAPPADLPTLLVQLPVFRERTVAARAVRAAGALDWPRERLALQVLDDSDDETCAIVDAEVAALVARGVDARVLRRAERTGFKAGALAAGLAESDAELVLVLDADFTPRPDLARRLVRHLADPAVAMVQARWGHANREESWFTRAQATLLDGHFHIEHRVRALRGLFFNFNGTAGIWRRAAIDEAGGWSDATLTEDLDLSYRSQLAGRRFAYAGEVKVSAELPAEPAAFRTQQARWATGGCQVLRRLGPALAAGRPPGAAGPTRAFLAQRTEALLHLGANVGYPAVLALALLLPAALVLDVALPAGLTGGLILAGTLPVALFYVAASRLAGRRLGVALVDSLLAMALGIGICAAQTRAVLRGLLPGRGVFVRTPKRGDRGRPYRAVRSLPVAELLLAAWTAWGLVDAVREGCWVALPLQVLFLAGFLWVGLGGLLGPRARERASRPVAVTDGA